MESLIDLKRRVRQCNCELPARGLALETFGNVSGFAPEGRLVAIKPSGVSYAKLTDDDIVMVDLDGRVVEGRLRPSSDTRTRLTLYREHPGLGGIVHVHSPYATA